jgi:hypothetical protein
MTVATKIKLKSATKKWRQMSKAERRVALAEDVLSLLKMKRMVVESGCYIRKSDLPSCKLKDDARAVLSKTRTCKVCAKGGLLFARIMSRNALSLQQIGGQEDFWMDGAVCVEASNEMCVDNLRDSFPEPMLDAIEAAFEGQWINGADNFELSKAWYEKYPKALTRLKKIMQRIVDNSGEFTAHDVFKP